MEAGVIRFHWVDYLMFALMLSVSAAIGLYYGIAGRKNNSTKDFLLGGRNMQIFPVTLSILASFMSAVSVLGTPAEVYSFGTMYMMLCLSYFIVFPVAAHVYMPIFHNLQLTSAHQYLEMRFNRVIRIMVSALFIVQMMFYMAIVIYAPALAFSQVTGLNMVLSVVSIGAVCTFYTALGGMKAVMWTDVFQMLVVYAGLFAVIIQGTIVIGGFGEVWQRNLDGGRIKFIDFDPDPLQRHTLFTLVFGGFFTTLTVYGANQTMLQRYLSVRKLKDAQIAVYSAMIATFIFLGLLVLTGVVMYAYYYNCDPISAGIVQRGDQVLPHLVMEILRFLPGMPGVFMSCVFSAALSTVSSGVNALATVCLEDFIRPCYEQIKNIDLPERAATILSKLLALAMGLLTLGLAFLASVMPSTLVQISLSIFGMAGGPILGVFTAGILFPFINSLGVGIGMVAGISVAFWLGIGAVVTKPPLPVLPLTTDGCNFTGINVTMTTIIQTVDFTTITPSTETPSSGGFNDIYKISYLYYSPIAVFVIIIVASLVSWCSGFNGDRYIDSRLIYPVCDKICCCLPKRYRCLLQKQRETIPCISSTVGLTKYSEDVAPSEMLDDSSSNGKLLNKRESLQNGDPASTTKV
ncbi:sodium-coupled monocarboxylate transporter 1-like [Tubulanus polymorphus]|uniref:sodium-coupled monocarboxylate transporter 1-like n=1 Tax=Tubulanus polymorphus TaxID=672921 RepID=UPI003DA2E5D7